MVIKRNAIAECGRRVKVVTEIAQGIYDERDRRIVLRFVADYKKLALKKAGVEAELRRR